MQVETPTVVAKEFDWLKRFNKSRFSQFGEDGFLLAILKVIGPSSRWTFDCGAGDGVTYSNTLALLEQRDWRGVCVERNKRSFKEMERRHFSPGGRNLGLNTRVIRVRGELAATGDMSPEGILDRHAGVGAIDVMSLDIDGGEDKIVAGFTWLRPRVLCVEYVHNLDMNLEPLMAQLDVSKYVPVAMTLCNLICVPIELVAPLSKPQES